VRPGSSCLAAQAAVAGEADSVITIIVEALPWRSKRPSGKQMRIVSDKPQCSQINVRDLA